MIDRYECIMKLELAEHSLLSFEKENSQLLFPFNKGLHQVRSQWTELLS